MDRAGEALGGERRAAYAGAAMVLGAAALWGTIGYFGKLLYREGFTPLELASIRAVVSFLGIAIWTAARPAWLRIRLRDLPFFVLYGLVGVAIFEYIYFAAIERTTVAIAAALLYTAPAFVTLLAWPLEGERPGPAQLLALVLVLAGVFLVTGALATLAAGGQAVSGPAVALGLGSGLTYGFYTLFGKRALRRYDPVRTVFYAFAFGSLFLAMAAPPWRPVLERPSAIPLLILVGVVPTLIPYLLYLGALRRLPAATASMLATAEPVVATLLGVALLGEALGAAQAAGIGLIVGAALLLARRTPAPVVPPAEAPPDAAAVPPRQTTV